MRGKRSEIIHDILKALALGAGIFLILSSPSGARRFFQIVGKEYIRRKEKREYLLKRFYYLRNRNLIEFIQEGDMTRIVLTEQGKRRILTYDFEKLILKKTRRWDGKWHLIIFDVPETKKRARDALSLKLKTLGLIQFNRSVWVSPYACKDEIDFVAEFFDVGKYVHYVVAESMTNEENLRALFAL